MLDRSETPEEAEQWAVARPSVEVNPDGFQTQVFFWVGGMAPHGYETKNRKISVNEADAERVRTILRSYFKLGSLNLLTAGLRKRGFVTKVRTLKSGEKVGGNALTGGPLAHLLRN